MKTARNSQSGVALILVLLSLALLTVLSVEILVASRVDLRIGRNARDRLQAYYLAQSAARFALLRLYLYESVNNLKVGAGTNGASVNQQFVDGIWSLPLPNLPFPGMDAVDWPGTISSSISSEGSKIPINFLDGNPNRFSSQAAMEAVRRQLEQMILGLLQDEDFDKTYRGLKPDDLINPLQDWVSEGNTSVTGGDKTRVYDQKDPPYRPREDRMPTLTELHMVDGWNDDLVNRMSKNFTILGLDYTLNPNLISLDRLKTFGPQLSDEDLQVIQKQRLQSPFANLQALETFIRTNGEVKGGRNFTFGPDLLQASSTSTQETTFFATGTGIVGEVKRNIRLGVRLAKPAPTTAQQPGGTGTPGVSGTSGTAPTAVRLSDPQVVLVEETL